MSVRKNDRKQGTLHILDTAKRLLAYTLARCSSDKIFPKKARWLVADKIANEAIGFVMEVKRANAINLNTDAKMRYEAQIRANGHLECLMTLLDASFEIYSIPASSVDMWTGLCLEAKKSLVAWIKSDKARTE